MGWILGWVAVMGLLLWLNKGHWDRLKKTPHNSIKGLDYTDTE